MTDPQLPPPYGAVPPAPPAFPAPPAAYPAAAPSAQPGPGYPPVPPAVPQAPAGYPQAPAPQAPPGAYQVPVGGYTAPQGGYVAPQTAPSAPGGFLGILALILGGIAAIGVPIIAGIAGFEIGVRIPSGIDTTDPDLLSALSPARTQVLWAEISFWVGTVIGIAAIVVGIIAIRKKQRRALGIVGLILAVLGAGFFWIVLVVTVSAGTATGIVNY